jgi:hypothetical protein
VENPVLREEFHSKFSNKAAGDFRWVVLIVDVLNKVYQGGEMSLRKSFAELE